ncbi:helix-turn-helix transcriptional regulator [Streptomyces sp. HU2014]|uniref:helix-turn-helix transcriptional regulator n=1 Tax=Streptomyces sp. HU2014 TaxID=2939414 RepID=UPI00200E4D2A|nr:helix-turn-helix transcriptional regulator [Streptomyces sp. HU2014]UQI45140.1 helix-turn-helix transcriptional regulator [Streptomyces sp. HU2014]
MRDPARRMHLRCSVALARAAERAEDQPTRTARLASAACHARRAGLPRRATALDALALQRTAETTWAAGDRAGFLAAARRLGAHGGVPGPVRDYHRGVAAAMCGDGRLSAALLRTACRAAPEDDPHALLYASRAAMVLGRLPQARALATSALTRAGRHPAAVPRLLTHLALVELVADRYARAESHALRGLDAALAAGRPDLAAHLRGVLAMAASVRGDGTGCRAHARAALATARTHGLMVPAVLATWSLGLLDLAHNLPEEAVERLRPLVLGTSSVHHFAWRQRVIPYFVEAVALAAPALPAVGRRRAVRQARATLRCFEEWAEASADRQGRATALRCRALLAAPGAADPAFDRALALMEGSGSEFAQARTSLLTGMSLRRRRRPGEACAHLRGAMLRFEACGADVWVERARDEMRAAGRAEPETRPRALASLTPQQLRVARHVAEGRTNREVAALLTLSHRTVDHHLRNVFATLGIRSRVQLVHALAPGGDPPGA